MTTLLDTRAIAPFDRPDYWSMGIAEPFFPLSLESVGTCPFQARLTGGRVGQIAVHSISGVPHSVERSRRMIAADDPGCVLLYLLRSGSCRIEQGGRACLLAPGDIALHDTSRPSAFEARDQFSVSVFTVPRWLLGARADATARRAAVRMAHGKDPVVRLAATFLAELARSAESSVVSRPAAGALSDMFLAMLRALYGDRDDQSGSPMRSDTLLARMRQY